MCLGELQFVHLGTGFNQAAMQEKNNPLLCSNVCMQMYSPVIRQHVKLRENLLYIIDLNREMNWSMRKCSEIKQTLLLSVLLKNQLTFYPSFKSWHEIIFFLEDDAVSSLKWLIEINELCAMCKEDEKLKKVSKHMPDTASNDRMTPSC